MKQKYTPNFEEVKPLDVLDSFDDQQPLLLIVLAVYPQHSETGLLEERRKLLRQIWDKIISAQDEITGCSLSWSQLFFAAYVESKSAVIQLFQEVSAHSSDKDFQVFCIFSKGDYLSENKVRLLDVMQHEISSKRDFGYMNHNLIKMLDGKIINQDPEAERIN